MASLRARRSPRGNQRTHRHQARRQRRAGSCLEGGKLHIVRGDKVLGESAPPIGKAKPIATDFALQFDGVKSHVEIPDLARSENGPVTVEAYVTPQAIVESGYILRVRAITRFISGKPTTLGTPLSVSAERLPRRRTTPSPSKPTKGRPPPENAFTSRSSMTARRPRSSSTASAIPVSRS